MLTSTAVLIQALISSVSHTLLSFANSYISVYSPIYSNRSVPDLYFEKFPTMRCTKPLRRCVKRRIAFAESDERSEKNILHPKYALGLVEWSMRFTGLWPMHSRLSNLRFATCAVSLSSLAVGCAFGMRSSEDVERLIECLLYFIVMLSTLSKLLILKCKRKSIKIILTTIAHDCGLYNYLPKHTRKSITSNIKDRKRVTLTTSVFLQLSIAAYVISSYEDYGDLRIMRKMPFFIGIPDSIIFYSIFYFLLIAALCCFFVWAIVIVTADSLFAIFMVHATNQFTIVSDRLRMYDDDRYRNCISKGNYWNYCKCLKCIIKQHIAILRFKKEVENSFETLLFIEVTRNIVHFGIQMYNLIWFYKINSIIKLMHVAVILFSMNLHLVLYCFFAKAMTSAGEQVAVRAFKMKWYDFRGDTVRNITLVMQQSQKPCIVSAGRFINVSLETYIFVMKTAISYASFILAIRGRT